MSLRELSKSGRLDVVPCHYSALPRMFAERRLPCDVGLMQVSPPDTDGMCSLGVGVDYVADAIPHTPVLIAEINAQMPATRGRRGYPLERFAATIATDRRAARGSHCGRPARPTGLSPPGSLELIDDGDTVQIGVGSLGAAMLDALASMRIWASTRG